LAAGVRAVLPLPPMMHINAEAGRPTYEKGMWQIAGSAPRDRDLELAVIDKAGVHVLVFPCRRIGDGWVNAITHARIDVRPTHWREWGLHD
jgi:hypothetical protein